ncbi:DNA-directed RNA polymerase III subunit RPC7 [Danio rerio]|uniref:DNA-directed RNA polymerase III subunit RPC7 n=1 Tax=Danio rerio TaxID=7955 RepID=B0R0T5_DANRE|nr:DNA-directed RNA polymerase III subunit RPC7 [Danio rerio]|eukprot:NP_001119941.1 DNA-directed RNA polymerase III subunit RPC7 [Danio rerio]
MAGKGRGVAAFSFNIESLGLTRGSMPETQRGPAPLFPQIEYKPGPLKAGEDEDYMRALKQEMRGRMKDLPFNIKHHAGKGDVERYKEKYTREIKKLEDEDWTPDWNRLPKELKPQKSIKKKKRGNKSVKISTKDKEEVLNKLDELEKKGDVKSDEEDEVKKEKKEDDEEGEEAEIEGDYDEEFEEDNDYIASYFEDGDDFGGGSDDNMDEATY